MLQGVSGKPFFAFIVEVNTALDLLFGFPQRAGYCFLRNTLSNSGASVFCLVPLPPVCLIYIPLLFTG